MAKKKTAYFCNECGFESPKWMGKCQSCGSWNSFVEEIIETKKGMSGLVVDTSTKPERIIDINSTDYQRILSYSGDLNRILGGGIVPGSVVLLGGEPGVGKSTLALQIALRAKQQKVLYVSGEESPRQIKQRGQRLGFSNDDCLIYCETHLSNILQQVKNEQPKFVVIDSIQTVYTDEIESVPGSVSQVRECASQLLRLAKSTGIPVFIIGHINKDGNIAGPKVLEHIVDTVLQFDGENQNNFRILRAFKNRFGSTSEIGIFEMTQNGIEEVLDPSSILINQLDEQLSGMAVSCAVDGYRPFLIEIQSLVSSAAYGTPQRSCTGFEVRRLNMILAVLEKRAGFKLSQKDVFLNIAGGIKVNDPAIDLAVIAAVLSSNFDTYLDNHYCFAAETGLSGEIRPVNHIDKRIIEAEKLGFHKIFISRYTKNDIQLPKTKIEVVRIGKIEELLKNLFR